MGMKTNILIYITLLLLAGCASTAENGTPATRDKSLITVTPKVEQYSSTTVLSRLTEKRDQDKLDQLLLVSKILIPE